MNFKKLISTATASALLLGAVPVMTAFADDTDETGNTILSADDIKIGKLVTGSMLSGGVGKVDHDWYHFEIDKPGKVNVTLGLKVPAFFQLVDGNADNTVIDPLKEKQYNGTQSFTYYLTAGEYYIHLYNAYYDGGDYEMKVTYTESAAQFATTDNNNINEAAEVKIGEKYSSQISLNDDSDFFTFEVAEKSRVDFELTGTMDDLSYEIYDSEKDLIKKGGCTKAEGDSKLTANISNIMSEGTFTIAIKKNSSYGTYDFGIKSITNYNDISASKIFAAADINCDGSIDAADASLILAYYAYLSTGGTETDMNVWLDTIYE